MSTEPVPGGPFRYEFPGHPSVVVRRYRGDDVDLLFEAASESLGPGFTEWMPWCHDGYKREESAEYIGAREAA